MNCTQVREMLWKSKIAVKVEIHSQSKQVVPPLYLFIHRQHYLIFYYAQIHEHFRLFGSIDYKVTNMTLNYKNKDLPYQVPFGVLLELQSESQDHFTPINLVVQFSQEQHFTALESEIYNQYFFNFKQAILTKFVHKEGLIMLLQNVNTNDREQMFQWVQTANLDADDQKLQWLLQIYDQILDIKKASLIYLPIRVYSKKLQGRLQNYVEIVNEHQTIYDCLRRLINCTEFTFNGVPLQNDIPALYFYKFFYSFDGYCYFVAK